MAAGTANPLPPLPVLVVIVDEFAELYQMLADDIQETLDRICRQGRAYWMHLLMASQEIGTRAEKLLENMGYRMALQTKTASAAAQIGVPNAINLKGSGECYFLRCNQELISRNFRVSFCGASTANLVLRLSTTGHKRRSRR